MSWTKVNKVEGTCVKVDKTDKGWFQGWFTDWLSGVLWHKVNKETVSCTKEVKEGWLVDGYLVYGWLE